MIAETPISAAIMLAFMAAAFVWSAWLAVTLRGRWQPVHAVLALCGAAGAWAVITDNADIGMLAGIVIVLLAIAVMFVQKIRTRWLAVVELVAGLLLAAAIPFG